MHKKTELVKKLEDAERAGMREVLVRHDVANGWEVIDLRDMNIFDYALAHPNERVVAKFNLHEDWNREVLDL